jgi:hypothetical protein
MGIKRGPFGGSEGYLAARLQLLEHFAAKLDLEGEDDLEHYEDIQAVLSGVCRSARFFVTAISAPQIS